MRDKVTKKTKATGKAKATKPKAAKASAAKVKPPAKRKAAIEPATDKPRKQDAVIALMRRAEGATIAEMIEITEWQKHSCRGFIAGTAKRKLGLTVSSEKSERGRVYRVVA